MLVLREEEPSPALSGANAMRPLSALVPLDGSPLAEAVLVPAASLVTALSAPAQGTLHVVQVVKPLSSTPAEDLVSEPDEEAAQRADAYLTNVKEHMQATMKDLKLSITCSVVHGTDVAETLLGLLEQQAEGKETEGPGGSSLIAISTHGRGGLKRWVMGSVTERLLDATTLPMLIVRPRMPQAKQEKGA